MRRHLHPTIPSQREPNVALIPTQARSTHPAPVQAKQSFLSKHNFGYVCGVMFVGVCVEFGCSPLSINEAICVHVFIFLFIDVCIIVLPCTITIRAV